MGNTTISGWFVDGSLDSRVIRIFENSVEMLDYITSFLQTEKTATVLQAHG
jgi:hypothetical protein